METVGPTYGIAVSVLTVLAVLVASFLTHRRLVEAQPVEIRVVTVDAAHRAVKIQGIVIAPRCVFLPVHFLAQPPFRIVCFHFVTHAVGRYTP